MSKYLSMLKNLKMATSPTAKTAKTPFGSKGSTSTRRFPENCTPFGSKGSTAVGHILNNSNPAFDSGCWRRKIEHATLEAMSHDNGALSYCELFMPLLHRRYMHAANTLDEAFTSQDAKQLKQALREHDRAAEQTRKAAADPLTADQLSPAECSRFCEAHLSDKGGECQYLNRLDGWKGRRNDCL